MAEDSKIQWTTHTFNPWRGCTKISEGCQHCYAETMSGRNPAVLGEWGPNGTRVVAADAMWREPVKWNRLAQAAGVRVRVFCASLADVFEGPETMPGDGHDLSEQPTSDLTPRLFNPSVAEARERLFALIDATPCLDWLLLTKRPWNVMPLYGSWLHWNRVLDRKPIPTELPSNVWIGTSVENQRRAEERLPHLCRIPARVRFISAEPLLEAIDIRPWLGGAAGVNWVIVGGESGGSAREFNTDWARVLRDQCGDAGVPFFFKQTGSNPIQLTVKGKGGDESDIPADIRVREFPLAT